MAAGDVSVLGSTGRWIQGKRVVWGTVQIDGSNPTPVDLSAHLGAIDAVQLTLSGTSLPGIAAGGVPGYFVAEISGTTVNVRAAAPTSAADATPLASTNAAAVVYFLAIGKQK